MKARITISLRSGVLDPQGRAIAQALHGLGFSSVGSVRQNKLIEVDLAAAGKPEALEQLDAMCRQLLANPVIESYGIEIVAA